MEFSTFARKMKTVAPVLMPTRDGIYNFSSFTFPHSEMHSINIIANKDVLNFWTVSIFFSFNAFLLCGYNRETTAVSFKKEMLSSNLNNSKAM